MYEYMYIAFHPQVKRAVQQTGYLRVKRGFKPKVLGRPHSEIKLKLPGLDEGKVSNVNIEQKSPTDPLFKKEWYLVSIRINWNNWNRYIVYSLQIYSITMILITTSWACVSLKLMFYTSTDNFFYTSMKKRYVWDEKSKPTTQLFICFSKNLFPQQRKV